MTKRSKKTGKRSLKRFVRILTSVATVLVGITAIIPSGQAYPRPVKIESVSMYGDQPHRWPFDGAMRLDISSTGRYVAFNGKYDLPTFPYWLGQIYVADRVTKRLELASVDSVGLPARPPGVWYSVDFFVPRVSRNGRYVVFQTNSPLDLRDEQRTFDENQGDTPADPSSSQNDVYVRDLRKGTTTLVSWGFRNEPATAPSTAPSMSDNGRYIAFMSGASNLVRGDTNHRLDVFVYDQKTKKIERASLTSDESEPDAQSWLGSISRDGRYVVFNSEADNLGGGPAVAGRVYLRDLKKDTTELVSIDVNGRPATGRAGFDSAVSDNGRFVLFYGGQGHVPNEGRAVFTGDVHVRDRRTDRTERVSISSAGEVGEWPSSYDDASPAGLAAPAEISANGRFVSFVSHANDLVDGDTGGQPFPGWGGDFDSFRHDRLTGETVMVDQTHRGDDPSCYPVHPGRGDYVSTAAAINANGRYVAFGSCSDELVAGDGNRGVDIFVRDMGEPLAVGGIDRFGRSGPPSAENRGAVCLNQRSCIHPPGGVVRAADDRADVTRPAADGELRGARLAIRSELRDLFVSIEADDMSQLDAAVSSIIFGTRFGVSGREYEVRASSSNGGTFGLFDCGEPLACTHVTNLRGGYGTTGERVVVSIPLDAVGLEDGGVLQRVEAFSALGSHEQSSRMGNHQILDRIRFR